MNRKGPVWDFDNGERTIRINRTTGEAYVMVLHYDEKGIFKSAKWMKIEEGTNATGS